MLVEVTSRMRACRQVKLTKPEDVNCGDKAWLLVAPSGSLLQKSILRCRSRMSPAGSILLLDTAAHPHQGFCAKQRILGPAAEAMAAAEPGIPATSCPWLCRVGGHRAWGITSVRTWQIEFIKAWILLEAIGDASSLLTLF